MKKNKENLEKELFEDDHELDFLIEEEEEAGKKKKSMACFIVLAVIVLIVAVLVVFNPVLLKLDKNKILSIFGKKPVATEEVKIEETETEGGAVLSGQLKMIDKKLGLINSSSWGYISDSNPENEAIYYEAGMFGSGTYKGYKRIILLMPQMGPGSATIKILATNDDQKYVLDGNPSDVGKTGEDSWQNPLGGINKEKITKVDLLDSEHPSRIELGEQFNLYRGNVFVENVKTVNKTENGDPIWGWQIGDYSNLKETKNDFTKLKMFASNSYEKPSNYNELDKDYQQKIDQYIKYTAGRSTVIIVDSTGLPYEYHLGNKTAAILGIKSNDMVSSTGLYKEYGYSFPGGCGGESDTLIAKDLRDSDLTKITEMKKDGIEVYRLKNKEHPLLKLAYDEKTDFMYTGDYRQPYTITDVKDVRPSYEDYLAKPPLLFFKDSLGRWNMFVEYQYLMPGGCGKPVLYFYPEKPTEITVNFAKDMLLARDIPKYSNGWKILADENSNIKDLQPSLTNCSEINSSLKGLEYANSACKNNNYPYIYWAGDVIGSRYPEQHKGWTVDRSNLQFFMNEKLDEIGLSAKEKTDMLEYWIPEMLGKNAPYYKISFIQDKGMDSFIPMNIIPKPDSFGRVFLDWLPLSKKIKIQPQELSHIVRNGFTVVEWGGIKK